MANNKKKLLVILVLLIVMIILHRYCFSHGIERNDYINDLKVRSISIEKTSDSAILVYFNSPIAKYNGKIRFYKINSSYYTKWFGKESLIMSTSNFCNKSIGCERIVITKLGANQYSTSVYSEINECILYKIIYDKEYNIKQFVIKKAICYSKDNNVPVEWFYHTTNLNQYKEITIN